MSAALEIGGGGFDSLLRAVEEARRGTRVKFVEPRLRAGGAFATESFLSPFRFNLGPTLVPRPPLPALDVATPELLVSVGGAALTKAPRRLQADGDVGTTLDSSGVAGDDRTLLTALALFVGIDPEGPGSGAALADLCARIDELEVIAGGNGLAAACLVDELVAAGADVIEGCGPVAEAPVRASGLGICRLFVGLRGQAPTGEALATGYGFSDEVSLYDALARLRDSESVPLGFAVSNAHLDAEWLGRELSSFVWQGILPFGSAVRRDAYAKSVFELLGIAERDVVFQLLWLPEDTTEALAR
jgi:hypothetical protein